MRRRLPLSLFLGTALIAGEAMAQHSERIAYAVTDMQQQGPNWNFLRRIDLETGTYSDVLLNGNDMAQVAFNASSKKQFGAPISDPRYGNYANAAFATGVAAMAYDKRNNRLYYTPMLIDQLRYIDLKTMKVFYVTDQGFSGQAQKSTDQGNIITRMVIASDGYGYAMTNDGTQLLRFSTGKNLSVTDLGAVVDDQANNGVSVHNSCSSFGGDMIADDNGNIYVFSARNHVFKINIETKVATLLGVVSGLPANFTINGAAVTNENKVLVASATQGGSLFTVDIKSLVATTFNSNGTVWQTSDLANGNLLQSNESSKGQAIELISRTTPVSDVRISIFPNPVTANQFTIQFNQLEAGTYTVQVTDVSGRNIIQQNVAVGGDNQVQTIKLGNSAAKGIYMVKVIDQASRAMYNTKLVVQ